jgi:hypothetical protein
LIPAPVDPELSKNALAHALLPGYLYYNLWMNWVFQTAKQS